MNSIELANNLGMLTENEVMLIKEVARLLPQDAVCVNFGAGFGTSSLAVIEERNDLSVGFTTIDIREGGPFGGLENERNAFKNANMQKYQPHQILGDDRIVGKDWNSGIDFLFIDGGHFEYEVAEDIKVWNPYLNKDGFMLFHDCDDEKWPEVRIVVDRDVVPYYELYKQADKLIVFKNTK